jgi:hypothetical protein
MTAIENILARFQAALIAASVAGGRVYRDRPDAIYEGDLPAVKVMRGAVDFGAHGEGILLAMIAVRIELLVATVTRESDLDVLHGQVHAALLGDAQLAALGRGLRPTGTDEPQHAEGDPDMSAMTLNYQIQTIVRAASLASAI